MAIELKIIADTAAELIETINGLSTLGRGTQAAPAPAKVVAVEPEALEETASQTTERRTRRTKAEMEAAAKTHPQPESTGAAEPAATGSEATSATGAQSAATNSGAATTGASDSSSEQPTRADAEAATTAFCDPNTGKGSMKQAREILRANFLTVEGQPVDRLGPLQPKDFAAYIALLK